MKVFVKTFVSLAFCQKRRIYIYKLNCGNWIAEIGVKKKKKKEKNKEKDCGKINATTTLLDD